jgi:hypothetical protein
MSMTPKEISARDYRNMNVVTAYILCLAASQSMGIIGAGFKSPKHAVAMLSKRFPAVPDADVPLGSLPYITRQTVAYALSLVVSAVSYSRTCILTKGRAPMLYEKLYDELAKMTDDVFNEELLLLIRSYLYNTTATEVEPAAPASAAPRRAAAADSGGVVADDAAGGGASDGDADKGSDAAADKGSDAAADKGSDDAAPADKGSDDAAPADKGSDDAGGAGSQTSTPKLSPSKAPKGPGQKKGARKLETDAEPVPAKRAGRGRAGH